MSLPDFNAMQAALQDWAVAGTGLAESQVIWGQQEGPRPTGQYVELRIMGIKSVGQDWQDLEDVEDGAPGADVRALARGPREARLRVQCFAGPGVGNLSSVARLSGMLGAARLDTRIDALRAAGVGILQLGEVQSIDGKFGSSFEPRSVLEVTFSCNSELSELGTYIAAAQVQMTDEEGDPLDDPFFIGTPPTLAPPTDLVAVADDGTVTLTWTDAVGADSYNVYVGEAPGVTSSTGTLLDDEAQSPFVSDGLNNGTTYYYVVTTNNHLLDESIESDEVFATPTV